MIKFETVSYSNKDGQVSWYGVSIEAGGEFNQFLTNDVVSRLRNEDQSHEFSSHLRGLVSSNFAQENLNNILATKNMETRSWAVSEAIAEAYLSRKHNISWPWNMNRDMRNSNASLPGADLIGFIRGDNTIRLVFGEVKSSSDRAKPPGVMHGRHGMIHQIDKLANDLSIIGQLLSWLWFRCKDTEYESSFDSAVNLFLESGNKDLALFGVLVRDTIPDETDLSTRGKNLTKKLYSPTTCQLIAIYLPFSIDELPARVAL